VRKLETVITNEESKRNILNEAPGDPRRQQLMQEIQTLERQRNEIEQKLHQNVQTANQLEISVNSLEPCNAKLQLHVSILQHQLELQKAISYLQRESYRLQLKQPTQQQPVQPSYPNTISATPSSFHPLPNNNNPPHPSSNSKKTVATQVLVQPKPLKFKREYGLESIASAGEVEQMDIVQPNQTTSYFGQKPKSNLYTPLTDVRRVSRQSIAVSQPVSRFDSTNSLYRTQPLPSSENIPPTTIQKTLTNRNNGNLPVHQTPSESRRRQSMFQPTVPPLIKTKRSQQSIPQVNPSVTTPSLPRLLNEKSNLRRDKIF